MFILFNEKSITDCNSDNIDWLINLFIQTYKFAEQASNLSSEKFGLILNNDLFNYDVIKKWYEKEKRISYSYKIIFLHKINKNSENIKNSNNKLFFSFASSDKFKKDKLTINNKTYKNISQPEHVYKYLEYFPEWNNFNFNSWRVNFEATEHLLPVSKLSDLVWLNLIGETEIWGNKRQRKIFWSKFVEKLNPKKKNEKKLKPITVTKKIKLFEKITKINGFEKHNECKKQNRKIAKYPYSKVFFLTPDKQHGAFEVWNKNKIHQGEWTFYGGKTKKKADTNRAICK